MAILMADIPIRPAGDRPPAKTPKPPKTAEQIAQEQLDAQLAAAKKAQAEADAKVKAEKLKTAKRYSSAANDLQLQITALKDALKTDFAKSRRQNIADINLMLDQQLTQLKDAAGLRGQQFLSAAEDADKATADVQEAGIRNAVRERADTMTAILEQGAGETDALRAMVANARNLHNNLSDANRSYFDTMQSINQGIVDLNVDTKTALSNAQMTAEGQKELVWQDYYNRRAEAMTSLGNVYGQQADLLAQARDLGLKGGTVKQKGQQFEGYGVLPGDKKGKRDKADGTTSKLEAARKGMKKQFAAASNELGKSYVQKPLPDWIDEYEGTPTIERRQENTNLASAPIFEGVQKAQGATLRTW